MSNVIKNLPREEWKKLDFNPASKVKNYYVSNMGRLKSIDLNSDKERLLKIHFDKRQYARINLKINGKDVSFYLHKKIAEAFLKPDSDRKYIIHKNLNRTDNRSNNLKFVTADEQKKYVKDRADKYGFKPHGKGGYFKLTPATVALIKKYLKTGKTRKKMLAKRFGVSHTQINRIESGENWSQIEPAD